MRFRPKVKFLILVLTITISGCGNSIVTSGEAENSPPNKFNIGIIQIAEDQNLNAARKGFMDKLQASGYIQGQNLIIDYRNARNNQDTLQSIAQEFASKRYDLILALATPSAVAIARETTDIPILFTAVSDPIAVRLVKHLDQPQTNVTGTTDMNPIQQQFSLIKKLVPGAKCIGIIYNDQEAISQSQLNKALETAKVLNLSLVEATVGTGSEVPQAVNSLTGRVDVIYVPNDETVISAAPALAQAANQNKIPLFAGQKSFVNAGGLASISIDYERLGWQTGQMAIKILQGSCPETMAVENPQEFEIIINKSTARLLNIAIPDTLMPTLK